MKWFKLANLRSYQFMLEGLAEVRERLEKRNIQFVIESVSPEVGVTEFVKNVDAALLICDRGYLKLQKKWRVYVSTRVNCGVIQVESDVVVPVETVSLKEEFAARTIRPKIHKLLKQFLVLMKHVIVRHSSLDFSLPYGLKTIDLSDVPGLLKKMNIDHSVHPTTFKGGTLHAKKVLLAFIEASLKSYGEDRNEPSLNGVSGMSPYLHFGQISPL